MSIFYHTPFPRLPFGLAKENWGVVVLSQPGPMSFDRAETESFFFEALFLEAPPDLPAASVSRSVFVVLNASLDHGSFVTGWMPRKAYGTVRCVVEFQPGPWKTLAVDDPAAEERACFFFAARA